MYVFLYKQHLLKAKAHFNRKARSTLRKARKNSKWRGYKQIYWLEIMKLRPYTLHKNCSKKSQNNFDFHNNQRMQQRSLIFRNIYTLMLSP